MRWILTVFFLTLAAQAQAQLFTYDSGPIPNGAVIDSGPLNIGPAHSITCFVRSDGLTAPRIFSLRFLSATGEVLFQWQLSIGQASPFSPPTTVVVGANAQGANDFRVNFGPTHKMSFGLEAASGSGIGRIVCQGQI